MFFFSLFQDALHTLLSFLHWTLPQTIPSIILLILGFVLIFSGKHLIKLALALSGLACGLTVASWIQPVLQLPDLLFAILCLFLSIGFALLFSLAYRLSFLLAGAILVYFLFNYYFIQFFQLDFKWILLFSLILGAVLGSFFRKKVVEILCLWLGWILVVNAIQALIVGKQILEVHLLELYPHAANQWYAFLIPLILVAGTLLSRRLVSKR